MPAILLYQPKNERLTGTLGLFVVNCYDPLGGDTALMKINVLPSFLIVRKMGVIRNTL